MPKDTKVNPAHSPILPFTDRAASIVAMVRSRSLRRLVAGAAGVLFLACQSASVVIARSANISQSDRVTLQGSCHDPEGQLDRAFRVNACQKICQSQVTAPTPPSAAVFTAADLPAVTSRAGFMFAFEVLTLPAKAPPLHVKPPALAALHCCLRN